MLVRVGLIAIMLIVLAFGINRYRQEAHRTSQLHNTTLQRGIALYHQGNFSDSVMVLGEIPPGAIQDWRLPFYKASALVKLKKYQPAAPLLEQALSLNTEETKIRFALGVVYYKLGNLSLAKGYFASTLEIDPTNEHAKGLMDIMSKLQRQSKPGTAEAETGKR